MKVLKFGGTSISTVEGILNVKSIVEAEKEPVIVVFSAVGGVTDKLLQIAISASNGNLQYTSMLEEVILMHKKLVEATVIKNKKDTVLSELNNMFEELSGILHGVFLIKDLSGKTSDLILSYGERISANFMTNVITNATYYNALNFIQTEKIFDKHSVKTNETAKLIQEYLGKVKGIAIVPGFISTDIYNKNITNLGRGGSDYTASLIAAELNAKVLEIWTDVDGFMTADPKVINNAYLIEHLSYVEAMELCNFGAKVIYPPTIYPVFHKKIPILVKNTYKPKASGTYISEYSGTDDKIIKGISSIGDTSLLIIKGLGMVGVIGINYRIFKPLAKNGISIFLVAQASSESSTTLGVLTNDAKIAVDLLNIEFEKEIQKGEMDEITAESGFSTVAIVGQNMRNVPGVAGKLFNTLGRNGINVIACVQGASQMHISFVVEAPLLRKALSTIHDSFFLSEYQVMNLFLAGVGTVGGNLLKQIEKQQQNLMSNNSLKINVVGISNSKHFVYNEDGINLSEYKTLLSETKNTSTPKSLSEYIIKSNLFNSIFVDCTANDSLPNIYGDLLKHNISVVTANKVAASSSYSIYSELKQMARQRGVKFLFETNVGAGLPIINTMNALNHSGDKIIKLQAVLSGTLNFIFNTLSPEISLSKAVKLAQEAGFSEPDPRIDLSGTDVIRKLVILSREAGYKIEQEDVEAKLFIPDSCFEGDLANFWKEIVKLDAEFEANRKKLASEGKKLRFVATLDNGKANVGLQEVDNSHPFYELEGSNNIILITTERYNEYPMMIKGYGAGAEVTAAGVFADIISIANIR